MLREIKKNWGLFIILIFSIIPLFPLFHTGFFPMHDDTQVARVFEMGNALKDKMIPVRWSQDLGYGYGYPLFTFYAPLAFYVGGIVFLGGFSALLATKIMMGIGILLSGVFMYYLARTMWGEIGGTLAGLFYLYAPYHALDIYVRGDVAEFWAYAYIPLAFLGVWKSAQTGKLRYIFLGAIGFAGIILSHNLTAIMVTPFLGLFALLCVWSGKKKKIYPLLVILLGLGFSAFYFLPVPFEMQYTNVSSQVTGGADFHTNFVCLTQLWNSQWGYGGSIPGCIDGISFALGKIYILSGLLSVLIIPFILKKDKLRGLTLLGSCIGFFLSLVLLLQVSEPLWNFIKVMAFFQYPWRFFILVFFFLSFASGGIFWLIEQSILPKKTLVSLGIFIVVGSTLILIQGKYFKPQIYKTATSASYVSKTALEWTTSETTNEYMPPDFQKPKSPTKIVFHRFILPSSTGKVIAITEKTQEKTASVALKTPGIVVINLAYFPSWHIFIDGKETKISLLPSGMAIFVPKGNHIITVVYKSTFVELLGNFITLLSIAITILVIIGQYYYEKAKR